MRPAHTASRRAGNGVGDSFTRLISLQPRPDGTLSGVTTTTVLTNECGYQGSVFGRPLLRPESVICRPALFSPIRRYLSSLVLFSCGINRATLANLQAKTRMAHTGTGTVRCGRRCCELSVHSSRSV